MPLPDCYRTRHRSDLNKISGRLQETREFILAYDPRLSVKENAKKAYLQRWYGNAGETKCDELTRHFQHRLVLSAEHLKLLRTFLDPAGWKHFPLLNHFFMLLDDPYYRWAASVYLAGRYERGLRDIPRSSFDQELKLQLPETVGPGSLARYGQNLLTALRDNGLLTGRRIKTIISPAVSAEALGFMLYTLSDLGSGANHFDGSPLFLSLLKERDSLLPVFQEGEREGYWEFTGDRENLSLVLSFSGLAGWVQELRS